MIRRFSDRVADELKCYVYRLIDPRNGTTFYVGRGRGNRVFAHAAEEIGRNDPAAEDSLKLEIIRSIVIHRHGMDEETAIEVEAALIDAYPGLTNLIGGSDSGRGVMHVNEVVRKYEADLAVFQHDVLLIDVGRTSESLNLYDAVRYAWSRVGQKGMRAKYALAIRKGLIIGAFEPERWLPATFENFPGLFHERDIGRWGFVGCEAPDQIRRLYVGKRAPERKRGEAWATRYFPTGIPSGAD